MFSIPPTIASHIIAMRASKSSNRVCKGVAARKGRRCSRPLQPSLLYCWQHQGQLDKLANLPENNPPTVADVSSPTCAGFNQANVFAPKPTQEETPEPRKPDVDLNGKIGDGRSITTSEGCGNTTSNQYGHTVNKNCGNTTNVINNNQQITNIQRPETAPEFEVYINNFITKNFPAFPDFDSKYIADMAEKVMKAVRLASEEFCLPPERAPGMAKLAMFDFVILCDNSTSMWKHRRALKGTLVRLGMISSLLTQLGISVRFLNYDGDSSCFDNLSTVKDIEERFSKVGFFHVGRSKLGTVLNDKVVQPMIIKKAASRTLRRPVITMIITDGQPTGEPRESFRNTIRSCKQSEALQKYGEGAAVFLLSIIGNSAKANAFVQELERDNFIKDMVYCSTAALNEQQAIFQRHGGDKKYTGWLMELFLSALEQQAPL